MSVMYCFVCDKPIDTDFVKHDNEEGECVEY